MFKSRFKVESSIVIALSHPPMNRMFEASFWQRIHLKGNADLG